MADNPNQNIEPVPVAANKLNPALLLFLLFPVLGLIAAFFVTRSSGNVSSAGLVPPPVAFTPTTLIGGSAPEVALQSPAGTPVQLSSLRGKWVYLNFWATWCPPCRQEMPLFQQLLNGGFGDYHDKLTVLAIDQNESADTVNGYLKQYNLDKIPVALDPDAKATGLYGVLNLPVTFVIDPGGTVRYEHIGQMTPEYLMAYLKDEFGSVGDVF